MIDRRDFLAASAASLGLSRVGQATQPGWEARTVMPWRVQEIYCAVRDGKIVVAGGLVGRPGGALHIEDRTAIYDPGSDVWSEGPKLPQARHHPMLIAGRTDASMRSAAMAGRTRVTGRP